MTGIRITLAQASRACSIACVVLLLAAAGCGSGNGSAAAPVTPGPPPAPVDPRLETADGLVGEAKSLLDAEPQDLAGFFDLFRWEGRTQEMYADFVRTFNLQAARFRAATDGRLEGNPVPRTLRLATLRIADVDVAPDASGDAARAEAKIVLTQGTATSEQRTLHLVEADGRWWISGLTVERSPDVVFPPHALRKKSADLLIGEIREQLFAITPLAQAFEKIADEAPAAADDAALREMVRKHMRLGVLDTATRSNMPGGRIP